jgi:hypothetical protein
MFQGRRLSGARGCDGNFLHCLPNPAERDTLLREFLAKAHQRNKPAPVPATLLGQLAIHKTYQGHARSLLLFALTVALRATRDVGSFGVLTHPIDEQVRQFYRRWGFEDVPFDPRQLMIVRMVDLQKSGLVA